MGSCFILKSKRLSSLGHKMHVLSTQETNWNAAQVKLMQYYACVNLLASALKLKMCKK